NILRYTEFKGDGHGIWTRVYREDDALGIYDWLSSKASNIAQASLRMGETAYFNVGDYQAQSTDSQGRVWKIGQGWETPNTKTGLVPFAKNSAGVTTLLSLSVLETGNNGFTSVSAGLARPGYDDIFARDGWYWSGTQSTWKLHGLIPGGTYAVEAYASGSA